MIAGIEGNFLSNNEYIVQFAQSEADVKAAQALRFNVFNVELGEGLDHSYEHQLDEDRYDEQCHHLLVIHRKTGDVIGTYRMQTHDIAKHHNGFYTAQEFVINSISQDILSASVEVGRACIETAHRNGRVLYLLWRGLARYLIHFKKGYLFGCCSLTSQSPREAWAVMQYLQNKNYIHDELMVSTTEKFTCKQVEADDEQLASVKLPQLFRLYLNLGARVCSPPALDCSFKTIDYLVLLDVEKLDERTRMLFFS